jgi:uncharacterized protein DUF1761
MLRFTDINLLAVVVAGLVTFFLGGLWYMPLFGKLWVRLQGYSEEKIKEMQAKMQPAVFFGGMIVCYLVCAFVTGVLVVNLNLTQAADGAILGTLLWLGYAAAIGFTGHLASQRHIGVFLIDTSFQLVFLIGMGILLSMWR